MKLKPFLSLKKTHKRYWPLAYLKLLTGNLDSLGDLEIRYPLS